MWAASEIGGGGFGKSLVACGLLWDSKEVYKYMRIYLYSAPLLGLGDCGK